MQRTGALAMPGPAALRTAAWGTQWGQLDGPRGPVRASAPGARGAEVRSGHLLPENYSAARRPGRSRPPRFGPAGVKTVTWLILCYEASASRGFILVGEERRITGYYNKL